MLHNQKNNKKKISVWHLTSKCHTFPFLFMLSLLITSATQKGTFCALVANCEECER